MRQFLAVMRIATAVMIAVAMLVLSACGSAEQERKEVQKSGTEQESGTEQKSGAPLELGAEIDVTDCAYGPGQIFSGKKSGQYFGDAEALYGMMFIPADAPGGHFRYRAEFPRARWLSYQSYDQLLGTQGVVSSLNIKPDRGSVNPFLPGQRYKPGHVSYTVDVRNIPPSRREIPAPPNVIYGGYRMDPSSPAGMIHTPGQLILYSHYVTPDREQTGDVGLPRMFWVVDDPKSNQFHSQAAVCAAMQASAVPWGPLAALNEQLDRYVWKPIEEPLLKHLDYPVFTDPVPRNPPYVGLFRPSSNGYAWPLYNQLTPYIYTTPSTLYGRFIVIRFKAPTHPRVEKGIPATGEEQTQYWSWCAGQFESLVNIATGCLTDHEAHVDRDGYVTLVVSPSEQRPVVNGKPYANWLEWPGGGALITMSTIEPNPKTFPQSPFFMGPNDADGLGPLADILPGVVYEDKIKAHMGEYFPQISYCNTEQFQLDRCRAPFDAPLQPLGVLSKTMEQ